MVFTHATRVRVPDGESLFAPPLSLRCSGCTARVTRGMSRLAQLVERKTLNLVVVGSSPTVGAYFLFFPTCNLGTLPRPCGHPPNQLW